MDYAAIKLIHLSAVGISGLGFLARGFAALRGAQWVQARLAKTLPHIVDTVLLLSALTLATLARINPAQAPWLLSKILGLLLYIALGMVALRSRQNMAVRRTAWLLALLVFAWIASVAITKNPLGFWAAVF